MKEIVESIIQPEPKVLREFVFEITTTALCDLACTYCFEGEKTDRTKLTDYETIFENIKFLQRSSYFMERFDSICITFWGGEPTLNPDIIIRAANAFKLNYGIKFMIYTNGYNAKNLNRILDHFKSLDILNRLTIQVSYDGKVINDQYRLTKTGASTKKEVLNNFLNIVKDYCDTGSTGTTGLNFLSLKATIPLQALETVDTLIDTWDEFYQIDNLIRVKYPNLKNINVQYSPTLDYVNILPVNKKLELVKHFTTAITEIVKKEYQFYKKYNSFIMSWFKAGTSGYNNLSHRSHCSAGSNLIALNVDGSLNFCHGSLYIKDSKDLKMSLNFMEPLMETGYNEIVAFLERYKIAENYNVENLNSVCTDCAATYCAMCPAAIYSLNKARTGNQSTSEIPESSSTQIQNLYNNDNEFNNCIFYKSFGSIDRILHKMLKEN
jgi:sulfatase maturation enzyme AslB (radical SAM superfamily)